MKGQAGKASYLTPGRMVGPYQVEEQLGEGGFGFVYRVVRDGQAYALKISNAKLSSLSPEDRAATIERLDREIASLKSLHHPNIVRVHTFDRWPDLEGGYPYLVMDLVDGSPLQEWRAATAPSLARLVRLFEKVADALAHMHQLGIIHRDLKSQNLLVTSDGEPFIVDFGIARPRIAYDVTRASGVGTLTHLTPEYVAFLDSVECRNGSPFDWRPTTDLYALGYVFYEALTGEVPVPRAEGFTAKAESELLAAIKGSQPRRPREIDPRIPGVLDALVMELLEKDPRRRPQEAAQVSARLKTAREAGEAAADPAWTSPLDAPGTSGASAKNADEVGQTIEPLGSEAEARTVAAQEKVGPKEGSAQTQAPSRSKVGRDSPVVSLPEVDEAAPFEEVEQAHAEGPVAPDGWGNESKILRRVAAEWPGAKPRARRWPLLTGAGASLLVLLLLVIAARAPGGPPRPRTLLSTIEPGGRAALPEPTGPGEQPHPAIQAPTATEPPSARTERKAPKVPVPGKDQAEPRGLDGDLEYGRLTLMPDGQVVVRRAPAVEEPSGLVRSRPLGSEPSVLQTSRPVASAGPVASTGPQPRGVPFGAHIPARLLTNLDTRTIANGPVEALLHVPYVVRGQVVLPTRTMVYGTASESGGRFTVRFTRLRLPDDIVLPFEGIALARDDGKPGLAASGRQGQEPKRTERLGTKIAKGTGNILLDTVTGGTPQSIARNAGQSVLNHDEPQPVGGGAWALLLDGGVVFDIFVEKAF